MMNFPPTNVKASFLHLDLPIFHHFVIAYITTIEFLSIFQLATVFLVYSACSFIVFDNLFERWFLCFQLKSISAPFILEIACLEIKQVLFILCDVCVPECTHVHRENAVSMEARRGCQNPWSWNYKIL